MYDVTALGELLIDFSASSTNQAGYPTMAANPGGAPANFLAALSRYGAGTAMLAKVGEDAFGRLLCGTLERAGICTDGIIRDPAVFTTLAFVTLDDKGERSFSFARKPGADTMLRFDELKLPLIAQARIFHFGTLSLTDDPARTATVRAVAWARERGKLITFDPNLRKPLWRDPEEAKKQILWGLAQADVVKISDDEVEFLWSCPPEEGVQRLLTEYGVKLAMVTMGERGCILNNGAARVCVAPPKVRAVDTTGAGDIFGGSAVSCLLRLGKAPETLNEQELMYIGRFASAAASLSTQYPGGIPSIPEREAVERAVDETYM